VARGGGLSMRGDGETKTMTGGALVCGWLIVRCGMEGVLRWMTVCIAVMSYDYSIHARGGYAR